MQKLKIVYTEERYLCDIKGSVERKKTRELKTEKRQKGNT